MRKLIVASVTAGVCMMSADCLAEGWTDTVEVGGDFRLRQEWIDQDGKEERNRARIRARLSVDADISESVQLKSRLATGVDDPVSANQTLDSGASTKDVGVDRFYIVLKPEALNGASLLGGKMKNPFISTKGLVFDSDLNPEGFAIQKSCDGDITLMLNGAVFAAEERSEGDDTLMYGGQAALQTALSDTVSATVGGSVYYWDNTAGFGTLYDSGDGFGNSTVAVLDETGAETGELLYAEDFTTVEGFAQLAVKAAVPVKLYGSYITNTEADDEDAGFVVGTTLGKAREVGSTQLDINYRDLEADAVLGAWTDSDSGGGGTGIEGFKVQGKYQIAEGLTISLTGYINELADGTDYNRGQLDLIASF